MGATQRLGDYMTTDLLCEWTDPDTAMELVGTSLGIFDARVPNPRDVLSTDTPMRAALLNVLLDLVEGGALEKRACSDGRYAFRWRADIASAAIAPRATAPPLAVASVAPPEPSIAELGPTWSHDPVPAPASSAPLGPRLVAQAALIVLPALSCLLVVLAFVWFNRGFAIVTAAALTLIGAVGVVRRTPFAGLWTVGLVLAGLLLRFS
jgi:hypothetical protein